MTVEEFTEDALISHIKNILSPSTDANTLVNIGDDCAVLASENPQKHTLLKTDSIVEKVHFTRDMGAKRIGKKAIARVISDFAAMAGTPTAVLTTLIIPKNLEVSWITELYQGMNEVCQTYKTSIVGGETTHSPTDLITISISATGTALSEHLTLRSGAKPGDTILVTGNIGNSFHTGKHLDFQPRIKEALWLANHAKPSAMMDISDGLLMDLRRLCLASKAAYKLQPEKIPITEGYESQREQALCDGEDYELLLTLPTETDLQPVLQSWQKTFPNIPLTPIGKIIQTNKSTTQKLTQQTPTEGWSSLSSHSKES